MAEEIQTTQTTYFAIDVGNITAIKDWVIVSDMQFDERQSAGGIVLLNDNGTDEGIRARWGCVRTVGPEQEDVNVGQWVLVDHGRWTRGVEIKDDTGEEMVIRRVDPKDIMMVSDEEPTDSVTFRV
jgi:co-chaperonin GroES (HSP10)